MTVIPIRTARPTEDHKYVAVDRDVRRGPEMIARARSHAMAKRIAYALNHYKLDTNRKRTTDQ